VIKLHLAALRFGGITEPERSRFRTEHHCVQMRFTKCAATTTTELSHPVGDRIVGDRPASGSAPKPTNPPRITCRDGSGIASQCTGRAVALG